MWVPGWNWLTGPQIWASLATLTAFEICLGIDNLVFIMSSKAARETASAPFRSWAGRQPRLPPMSQAAVDGRHDDVL
jgi:hypothetical protein